MAFKQSCLLLLLTALIASGSALQQGRKLMSDDMPARPKTGRQLLDMDLTTLTEGELIVHLYVYDLPEPYEKADDGSCLVTGFRGGPFDGGVPGHFAFEVPAGGEKQVRFTQNTRENRHYSIPQQMGNGAFSLADGIDFKPTEEGQNASSVVTYVDMDTGSELCTITLSFLSV